MEYDPKQLEFDFGVYDEDNDQVDRAVRRNVALWCFLLIGGIIFTLALLGGNLGIVP